MEMKNENSVIAISAWINPNASSRPVSLMLEQVTGANNLIGFMMGQTGRRVVTVSFSEDVAKSIGIDSSKLEQGYENASEININLSKILPFPVRIRVIESTDEVWARENYASIKKSGKDGVELVTSDGENIFRKQEFVQVATDGSSDDVFVAHVPLKDMGLDNTTTVTDEIKENKTEALTASSVF